MSGRDTRRESAGWLAWGIAVTGWLACAGMCLWLTIALEAWPEAYETLFPAVLLVLFGNILVFLFSVSRHGAQSGKLLGAVLCVCLGEGLLMFLLYVMGRYLMAA